MNKVRWEEMEAYLLQALEANAVFGGSTQVGQIARAIVEKLDTSQHTRDNLASLDIAREDLVDQFEDEVRVLDQQVTYIQSNCSHPALDVGQCFSTCLVCGKEISNV